MDYRSLLTKANFPCLETVSIIVFDKSNSSFMRGFYDLEERERPKQPERTGPSLVWINAWLNATEALAKKADVNHVAPKIRFVNLIRGSGDEDTEDKKGEVIRCCKGREYGRISSKPIKDGRHAGVLACL